MGHERHEHDTASTDPAAPEPSRWAALVLLCLAQFMLIVDITVVQVALPSIGAGLTLDREALTWVVATYTLVFGGLMIFGGRLGDAFGTRTVLLTGLALFTIASLVCGLAPSGEALIAGRAAQGAGAALLSPSALATITKLFHGTERNRALGVWAAIGGTGAAFGVLISGLLTAGPGWRWVFFLNVPIGLLVLLVLPAVVRAVQRQTNGERLDAPGALTVTVASALLIYGIVNAGDGGWAAMGTLVPLGAAALAYAVLLVIESRAENPLLRPETLARRPVVSGTFLMLIASGLLLAMFFLTSQYLQHVLGLGALKTGLLFLPVAIAITVGAQAGAHLLGKVGGRVIAVAAFTLVAVGTGLLTQISPSDNVYANVLPGLLIAATGVGPAFVTATSTTLANVPHQEAGVASGVINTFHELGAGLGVAVVSTIAAASIASHTPDISGFRNAYLAATIAAGAAALITTVLVPAGKPQAVVGHGH